MNKLMEKLSVVGCVLLVLCGLNVPQEAAAVEIRGGEEPINLDAQLQLHSVLESVDDPYSADERLFLFLRQARLSFNGTFNDIDYEIEWMMGGEEVPENNSVMSLLDAYIDAPLFDSGFKLKLGQFKVPYGRQRLLDSGDAFNVNRALDNNFFNIGRDVGAAIHTQQGILSGALGVFTGGGINIPERYLPEDIGVPMFVTRFGVNDGLDEDVFTPAGYEDAAGRSGYAAFINLMYNRDSRVGHSTPLNVKYYDKSLMLNSDWNPYINARDEKSEFYQVGADAACQFGVTEGASILLSAEGHLSSFENNEGGIETVGGHAGINLITENLAYGLRYGVVDPDEEMAFIGEEEIIGEGGDVFQITDDIIQEITASVVYTIRDYGVKLIGEVTYQMDVPVSLETGNGVYNLMRQPDQVTYASSGGIELQDNVLASLIVQVNF